MNIDKIQRISQLSQDRIKELGKTEEQKELLMQVQSDLAMRLIAYSFTFRAYGFEPDAIVEMFRILADGMELAIQEADKK